MSKKESFDTRTNVSDYHLHAAYGFGGQAAFVVPADISAKSRGMFVTALWCEFVCPACTDRCTGRSGWTFCSKRDRLGSSVEDSLRCSISVSALKKSVERLNEFRLYSMSTGPQPSRDVVSLSDSIMRTTELRLHIAPHRENICSSDQETECAEG